MPPPNPHGPVKLSAGVVAVVVVVLVSVEFVSVACVASIRLPATSAVAMTNSKERANVLLFVDSPPNCLNSLFAADY